MYTPPYFPFFLFLVDGVCCQRSNNSLRVFGRNGPRAKAATATSAHSRVGEMLNRRAMLASENIKANL